MAQAYFALSYYLSGNCNWERKFLGTSSTQVSRNRNWEQQACKFLGTQVSGNTSYSVKQVVLGTLVSRKLFNKHGSRNIIWEQ
jgi:Na+-transporting NADH:ubiquinone oxidoreductase subunit NqrA